MNRVAALGIVMVALFLGAAPASAYDRDPPTWNTPQIHGTVDFIQVLINGSTVRFEYVAGANPSGITTKDIFGDSSSPAVTTNALPLTLVANDDVVPVQYTNSCSGFGDGSGNGGGPSTGSHTACTSVPEPMTIFLGGMGLLALVYAGRNRLFRFAS